MGLTLDTGTLLALDRPSKSLVMQARLDEARHRGVAICVPVGVVAQAWRGPRQVRLARLLKVPDAESATPATPSRGRCPARRPLPARRLAARRSPGCALCDLPLRLVDSVVVVTAQRLGAVVVTYDRRHFSVVRLPDGSGLSLVP